MAKVALVYGVYDLTHYGHYRLFKNLYYRGYDVWVGVVTDEFVLSYKKPTQLNHHERVENVGHCKWVTNCFLSDGTDFTSEAKFFSPDVIAHGSDWTDEDYMKHMGYTKEFLKEQNIKMLTLPYTKGVSTTELIKRIRK